MDFQESNTGWQPMPAWVEYLIQCGFKWPNASESPRRIALISMPCDSAAAGLIALGAMIRDLGSQSANDASGHNDALMRHAHQHLKYCRSCAECDPAHKGCGFTSRASGKVRERDPRVANEISYTISDRTLSEDRLVLLNRKGSAIFPSSASLARYYIEGEVISQAQNDGAAIVQEMYAGLIPSATICLDNLAKSFSGLCLAGRIAGESTTREAYSSFRFRHHTDQGVLSELLSIHEWSPRQRISRMLYFNARTGKIDRYLYPPRVVVADGSASFLKVLGSNQFQQSDVIGVISRTIDRDGLEAIGNRMAGLQQWYGVDEEHERILPSALCGISATLLKRRG